MLYQEPTAPKLTGPLNVGTAIPPMFWPRTLALNPYGPP